MPTESVTTARRVGRHRTVGQFLRSRAGRIAALEVIVSCVVALYFFLTTFGFTEGMVDDDYTAFDVAVLEYVSSLRTEPLTVVMHVLSFLGAGLILVALPVVSLLLVRRRRWSEAALLVVSNGFGLALNLGLKQFIDRPRPSVAPLVNERFASYPSGHAMSALVFYLLIAMLCCYWLRSRIACCAVIVLAVLVIIAVGISRVYLGAHYPTDIMAGYIIGFWWALVCATMFRGYRAFRTFTG